MFIEKELTRCDHSGNGCPSRHSCDRYKAKPTGETLVAALNCRREEGATACDMFVGTLPTTFVE